MKMNTKMHMMRIMKMRTAMAMDIHMQVHRLQGGWR